MIGFLIGTACLIGLVKVMRHGNCGARGWGYRDDGGRFGRGRPPWARRGGFWLRGLFQRLDTTPGQEKVIREAFDRLRATAEKLREEAKAARPDIAKAIRSDSFDETVFGEISARIDDASQAMRGAVIDAVAHVHPVLDERQRAILADFLESGLRWGRGHGSWGPYRSQWT